MKKSGLFGFALALAAPVAMSWAVEPSPYLSTDPHTLHLYHFDESAGESGNPFSDAVGSLHLTNTGGISGRDNSSANGNGYGGAAYSSAFGSSFDVLRSGDTTFHAGTNGVGTGGGANSAGVAQSALQGADGAFTYEALVYSTVNILSVNPSDQRTILSHDGGTTRGFQLRVINGQLNFYNGSGSLAASLPTAADDDHRFQTNKWFHVAVTYTGEAGEDNLKFYWTALDSGVSEANLIGSASMAGDLIASTNSFGVGTITRSPYRFEWQGFIDEVRISDIARDPGDFILAPEPGSLGMIAIGGVALLARRRRASR